MQVPRPAMEALARRTRKAKEPWEKLGPKGKDLACFLASQDLEEVVPHLQAERAQEGEMHTWRATAFQDAITEVAAMSPPLFPALLADREEQARGEGEDGESA